MLTATEARRETDNVRYGSTFNPETEQKSHIERCIRNSIHDGFDHCVLHSLMDSNIEWLKSLGYHISKSSYKSDAWVVIRW